jgi:hypothetical protein
VRTVMKPPANVSVLIRPVSSEEVTSGTTVVNSDGASVRVVSCSSVVGSAACDVVDATSIVEDVLVLVVVLVVVGGSDSSSGSGGCSGGASGASPCASPKDAKVRAAMTVRLRIVNAEKDDIFL